MEVQIGKRSSEVGRKEERKREPGKRGGRRGELERREANPYEKTYEILKLC